MESRSCARTRDVVLKRKCEQFDFSTSVQHTPKKRSSLHRLSQSISNSIRVVKKNRSLRRRPTASICVLSSAGEVSRLDDRSCSHADSRLDASLLNETSIYMQTTLASNDTAISHWRDGDCSRDISFMRVADDSVVCAERPPKYRRVAPNSSLGQRLGPEGASSARCSEHYTKGRSSKTSSLLGRSLTGAQSYDKRYSNTSLDLYTHDPYSSGLAKLNGSLFVGCQAINNKLHEYRHQQLNCTYTQGLSLAVGEESSNKLITASSVNNISKQTAEQARIDTAGRVASWAVNFEKLLKDPIGVGIFTEFLKKEFSEENVIFWKACEQYRQLADEHQRKVKAKDIYTRYLSTKASDPVNVDSAARTYSEKYLENPTAIMFDVAQQQIFQLMRQDSYARFLKSDMYKNKLMEEMEGKPLESPVENSKELDGKKKVKGKENDDKRRRSILPWKNSKKSSKASSQTEQKGKKEKEASKPQLNVSMASLPPTSTVTNSSGNNNLKKAPGPGIDLSTMRKEVFNAKESYGNTETHFKFCRIVMPDGSTTVVCAKPGQTCRSVLSKLCEKRSISIASVDVFLLGSDKPLDLNEDISTLGSKEIVIERRVLFRLDLPNGKSIGVKAKPNRSIRDVFKPILTKYGYHIDSIGVHFMGFQDFLDLNTSVSELDNQRVVIVQDIDTAEILRQGVQPVALNPTKVPPANRSKSGHRGGSLEEITNKIFEDLMRGKSQLAHGFDELGVLELDKAKVHKNEEGRYLGLFGLLRKESTAIKDIHKGNKSKGKVTFTLPKSDVKKKVSTKEGERLIDMLSSAQKLRLEEQRGIHVSTGDLPSFLLVDNEPQETLDSLKDSQINNQSPPSGVAMFDDIEEISKVGFLEKTKRKEQLNYLGTTSEVVHGNHKMSRDTHKYTDKTVLSDKWKSLTSRSNHDNWTGGSSQPDHSILNMKNSFSNQESAVVTSQQTDTYLPMSPLIIDSKNDSHPLHSNGKCSTNARTTRSSPEIVSDLNSSNLKTSDRLNSSATQNSPFKIKVPSDSYTSNKLNERNKTPDPPSYHNAIRTRGVDKKHHPRSTDSVMAHTVNSVDRAENSLSFNHRVLVSPKSDEMIQRGVNDHVNDMSRRSLVSPRNDKPPYPPQRNTPLRASSPKLNIGATPSSNFYTNTNHRNSPQSASSHKFHIGATPTNDSHTTTLPNKRSATPVNLRSTGKWDLQFVNSPHATSFTFSPYKDSDHEEETVTFV